MPRSRRPGFLGIPVFSRDGSAARAAAADVTGSGVVGSAVIEGPV